KNINPVHIALISNASFVARAYCGNLKQLITIFKKAINHKGFAFVEIIQPCVTFNKVNTFQWYNERVFEVEKGKNYDSSNWEKAFKIATDTENNIATGVLYEDKKSISF